ncbi:patatin-like phospholipase family protein [Alteraurantiacibacter aquimixticola]|uniref:Patatin-like phospholipase family protein n=1 Tax=Alteraurantiacibacter aquimixticola TaxID=2489173 RepID=A0A4T3EZZ8_9SPHN|nr:patatin-like phospholipase family protein [Alteraurantiacibacter aquimixticola]TIX50362.1 patatin-like phospholipase family protein [Alteraurantiacibacter aquimixticola]
MAKSDPIRDEGRPQVLVLQGGGALGSYQAGVFETLHEEGLEPSWVAGISIGAINAAIIAGNEPEQRLPRLREFWELVSSELLGVAPADDGPPRRWFNELSAAIVAITGTPGFFRPRNPLLAGFDAVFDTVSLYDTSQLRETLERLVDFDLLNDGLVKLSVGAVNVLTGNFTWFDSDRDRIGPDHIMASGALPPGFPPVVIDGVPYWDGGLVSNTPLQYVLDTGQRCDMTIYQIDLFHARGAMPGDLSEVLQREKDIRYSSRTRMTTDTVQKLEEFRLAAARLAERLPPEFRKDPDVRLLTEIDQPGAISVMHLINRRDGHESYSKDYEFSRATVNEHWRTGRDDAAHSLAHPMWQRRDMHRSGLVAFDLTNPNGARMRDAAGMEIEGH